MALVTYSDSEGSDAEMPAPSNSVPKTLNTSKPTFKKVVDRSNPHIIRVNLPEPAKASTTDGDQDEDEPRAKRVKTSGGTFSGFNSLLPSPKRAVNAKGPAEGDGVKRSGLGPGVSLKTGATPGFSREPMPDGPEVEASYDAERPGAGSFEQAEPSHVVGEAKTYPREPSQSTTSQPLKKTTMFKPLSVVRKPQAKKAKKIAESEKGPANITEGSRSRLKKSLFSSTEADDISAPHLSEANDHYEPLIYQADAEEKDGDPATEEPDLNAAYEQHNPPKSDPNSLSSIADTLNLSASAKRQLLGRKGRNAMLSDASTVSVANFNMDSEYAANELLRQVGEQAQHNPVRSINAAGKNSLKQLVNTASSQKDALEEHFATGRRNKKEAGGKYGW